ncbi:MAG: TSUP family transporter [Clostridia bacterium]|nr:TSUP family transporter [Clostridia bacterium]
MKRETVFLLLVGGVAGFVNGFLGTGGGILLLFGSILLEKRKKSDARDLFAGTALVTLCLSGVSAVIYFLKGMVPGEGLGTYLLPAAAGGAVGAFLLDRLPTKWVERLFALLVLVAGGLLLLR